VTFALGEEAVGTQRNFLIFALALSLVVASAVVVIVPLSTPTPYIEYGEPRDTPYVVMRVNGRQFDVNDRVVAELVLVNPWNRNATVAWDEHPLVSFLILSEDGAKVYGWVRFSPRLGFPVTHIGPGEEQILMRARWFPTTVDMEVAFWDWPGPLSVEPAPILHGSIFCNERVAGEMYTLQARLKPMTIRSEDDATNITNFAAELFRAPVTFVGTPGPCLAEDPPRFELRVDEGLSDVNDSILIEYVLLNSQDKWLNLSFDFSMPLSLTIIAADGTVVYESSPEGWSVPYAAVLNFTLEPKGESLVARVWWNATSIEVWEHRASWFSLVHSPPPDIRIPGETYTIIGTVNWMTMWDGAAYDWDATPLPLRVAPQELSATVTFV
jgi:hypothetical protein